MKKNELIESARQLNQPEKEAAEEYSTHQQSLANIVIQILLQREDLEKLIGKGNQEMMKDNAHNMARFMESLFHRYNYIVLVETVLWVFRAYRSHGFSLTFWSAHLNTWMKVIEENLSEDTIRQIMPFYNWLQVNIPIFIYLTQSGESNGYE
jgi:hypothetical protein